MSDIQVNSIVKFASPLTAEGTERFIVLEDNGDRLLVEDICDLPIRPTAVYRKSDMVCDQAATLAKSFSGIIREWLSSDELSECVDANKFETMDCICHTHDYCDANEAMLQAFVVTDIYPHGYTAEFAESTEMNNLWRSAWRLAKQSGFSL